MPFDTLCFLLLGSLAMADGGGAKILGTYWLPEKDGQLEIYQQGDKYFGRVVSYDVAGQLDEKNPNPHLRSRPIVGVDLLSNFRHNEESARWLGGTIYDAKSGKTYKCRLWFENNDSNALWARGYIGISILGRTELFERVSE
jgi:uncharacterized protein (DUF2147 family)